MTKKKTILVLSKDGWCRAKRKTTLKYQESIKTACDYFIIGPSGLKKEGTPTCPQCKGIENETK